MNIYFQIKKDGIWVDVTKAEWNDYNDVKRYGPRGRYIYVFPDGDTFDSFMFETNLLASYAGRFVH